MDLDYSKISTKPFNETLAAIQNASVEHGFRVLHTHNVQQTLGEKGFAIDAYSIVEVCNAKYAYQVLSADKSIGMMLPCRIAVYEETGKTHVKLLKPTVIAEMMPSVELGGIPQEVEKILIDVVDAAVK